MRKTKGMKLLSGVTGAAALLSSCVVAAEAEQPVQLNERAGETYEKVANVKGTFSFVQDFMTPPDEVFNLFGTAATFACAKPGFAFDKVNHEDYYVNVGGNIKNCILNAAFLAAADPEAEGEVHMKHYLQAIKYEFVKTGKVFTRADFEPYASLVL